MSGQHIFYADDRGSERGVHIRTLEGKIGVNHFTVDQFQISAVAKRLCPDDCTVFKGDVFTVPCEIFPFYNTIFYRNILCVPKRVFRVKLQCSNTESVMY